MRRKLALITTGLLAGATLSVAAGTPAHACHEVADDPIYNWVCGTLHNAPDVKETIAYYSDLAFDTVHYAYCTVSPNC